MQSLLQKYLSVRQHSEELAEPLKTEDYSVQPIDFVSPPKWHLAHITWFWEEFVLVPIDPNYKRCNEEFAYLFNSYYNNLGKRVSRPSRGMMTRPCVDEVLAYRKYVDDHMYDLLSRDIPDKLAQIVNTGIQHEQQHQELLLYDIKYILGHQPFFPAYGKGFEMSEITSENQTIHLKGGVYEIGHSKHDFCFDNELPRHKVFIHDCVINTNPVTNEEYLQFVQDDGYRNFNWWHDDGWQWLNDNDIEAPLYWHNQDGQWLEYDLDGLHNLNHKFPVRHISYYEAHAFASWKKMRIPTEYEWEIVADQLNKGHTWEWTSSAYQPYPGYKQAPGALGEYNGKFMVNQMTLRGSSRVTPLNHSRITYRNFFHPQMRWQYAGLRLAQLQSLS